MADTIERTYTIPLRREFLKVPLYRRAKKATMALRQFLAKHMKTEDVKIGLHLNKEIWKNGMRNPPSRVKVNVIKKDNTAKAELFGHELKFEEEQAPKKQGIAERLKQKVGAKDEEKVLNELKGEDKKAPKAEAKSDDAKKVEAAKEKVAETKAEKAAEAKVVEKQELKDVKKEQAKAQQHAPKEPAQEKKVETHPKAPKSQ